MFVETIFQENESFTVEKNKEIVRTYEDFFNKYKCLHDKYCQSCKIEVNNHIFTMKTWNDFLKFLNLLNEMPQKFNVSFSFNDTNLFCNISFIIFAISSLNPFLLSSSLSTVLFVLFVILSLTD